MRFNKFSSYINAIAVIFLKLKLSNFSVLRMEAGKNLCNICRKKRYFS